MVLKFLGTRTSGPQIFGDEDMTRTNYFRSSYGGLNVLFILLLKHGVLCRVQALNPGVYAVSFVHNCYLLSDVLILTSKCQDRKDHKSVDKGLDNLESFRKISVYRVG